MNNKVAPRIYVADLAAYNAGWLHGEWIALDGLTVDELRERVEAILAEGTRLYGRETCSVHEEFAIHDYEGFGPIRVGEYDTLETVLGHAERMGDEPNKYFAWIEAGGDAEEFDPDQVFGPYESESDYFDQWIENCYGDMDLETVLVKVGVDPRVAESLSSLIEWIDPDQFIRDQGNPLVAVRAGEYSVEYWEVAQ